VTINKGKQTVEKIWQKNYQKGVPHEINPNDYSSLVELIEKSFKLFSNQVAYRNMDTALTYQEADKKSQALAAFFQHELKLKKGTRVAIMLPNLMQYPIAVFGLLRAGLIVVNTNPLYTAEEITHQLNDAGAEAIIVLSNFAHTLAKAIPALTTLKHVIVTDVGDLLSFPKNIIVNFVVRYIKRMIPSYHIPNRISFKHVIKKGTASPFEKPSLSHDDIAFLQYTGGTTGVAKGAVLTHGNMVSNVLQAFSWISPIFDTDKEKVITALPLYHIFSLTANCLTFLMTGAENVLITNPRDLDNFIATIKSSEFTAITGVNTMFNMLNQHPAFKEVDFSKLKYTLSGGMSLQENVARSWQLITKKPILEAYGLTETAPAVTMNPSHLTSFNGSIGLPIPSTELKICDDEGVEVKQGEAGEVYVRGPQVMRGYWKRPIETAHVLSEDGWLRTGDIGKIDSEGFVYLVDRKKDMIIVSGFNVYPNEVENIIADMPGVLEVGVIGLPHETSGELVKACVVKKDPTLTKEAIIAHCKEHLTAYKIPKRIEFFDELPKSNVGKILRRALRDENLVPKEEQAIA
jgi:long-chain acyl-CoA synthetase